MCTILRGIDNIRIKINWELLTELDNLLENIDAVLSEYELNDEERDDLLKIKSEASSFRWRLLSIIERDYLNYTTAHFQSMHEERVNRECDSEQVE